MPDCSRHRRVSAATSLSLALNLVFVIGLGSSAFDGDSDSLALAMEFETPARRNGDINGDGQLNTNGKPLMSVPIGEWVQIGIVAGLMTVVGMLIAGRISGKIGRHCELLDPGERRA